MSSWVPSPGRAVWSRLDKTRPMQKENSIFLQSYTKILQVSRFEPHQHFQPGFPQPRKSPLPIMKSLRLQTGEPNLIDIKMRGKSRRAGALPAPQMNIHGKYSPGSEPEPQGRGRRGIRLISSFLLSAIFPLVQYSLKVTVTNSDNFNTINKSGNWGKKEKLQGVESFTDMSLVMYRTGDEHGGTRGSRIIVWWVAGGRSPGTGVRPLSVTATLDPTSLQNKREGKEKKVRMRMCQVGSCSVSPKTQAVAKMLLSSPLPLQYEHPRV